MNEFENKNPEEMDEEVPENYITLTDDEGNDISFEIIGTVDYEGHLYAVMIPFDDEDDEVVILEIIPTENPDESEFLSVDDDDLLGEIFEEFKKNYDANTTSRDKPLTVRQIFPHFSKCTTYTLSNARADCFTRE